MKYLFVFVATILSLSFARQSNGATPSTNPDSIPFGPVVNYAAGDWPTSVFCADLDAVPGLDLAVANHHSDNVSILKNNGDGTFQPKVDYDAGSYPSAVFCADLDGDLDLDLAVPNASSDNVCIFLNNGDGTFEDTASCYSVGDVPTSVYCADLDTVPGLDLAVANHYGHNVSILKNNGDGTFHPKVDYPAGDYPTSVFCADLDGDLDLDLAVANRYSDDVCILKNDGDGAFELVGNYGVVDYPISVFCADLDGDLDLDLAVANFYSDSVSILLNLVNSRPDPFLLLSPSDLDSIQSPIEFDWEDAFDRDSSDTVWYALLVSKSQTFHSDSTTTFDSLLQSQYVGALATGTYYWKVKAYDRWGAVRWSNETRSFVVQEVYCDTLFISTDTVCLAPRLMKVTLSVANCDTLSAMTIPLHWETDCPGFSTDSVTFDSTTRIQDWENKTVITKPDTLILGLIADFGGGTPPLPPGEGPIAYIYFSIPCDTVNVYDSCFVAWDTTTVQPEDQGLLFVDNHDSEFVPYFEPGTTFVALYRPGDVNGNCTINVGDVVYLIGYLFRGGPEPRPLDAGDVNGDCAIDIGDVVAMVNYLYKFGVPFVCGCASHPDLAGSCSRCEGAYVLRKSAGSAQIGLFDREVSKLGEKLLNVEASFGADLAGIQLELSYDPQKIESVIPELAERTQDMKLFFSAVDGVLKIGIVDLTGEHVVSAGDGPLVRLRPAGSTNTSLRLNKAILVDAEAVPLDIVILPKEDGEKAAPRDFILSQNHPNPFNPETEISYTLPAAATVRLTVYNMLGQKVKTLVDEYQAAGHRTVSWDGRDEKDNKAASGIYFYRVKAGEFEDTKKMILMK